MSATTHPISWFEQRLGKLVNRNGKEFQISNKATAAYCHDLQESGFNFSDKPKVNISYAPESVCESCEG